ncbi:multidrug resistance-associated protein 1-like [Panonychus citri]|uniref:multidrug resistance-associated protein 1-like n=1 Tax=Panonychus citri TaxID=50023 RepID=UPI002307581C|nr:multidrug resistance-associated protein 1-like [Panonychus citri]
MSINPIHLEYFCDQSVFWNHNLTWNTNQPKLTRCFHQTVLNWLPALFLSLFSIFEVTKIIKLQKKFIHWNIINRSRLGLTIFLIIINFIQLINVTRQYDNPSITKKPNLSDLIAPFINISSFTLIGLLFYCHQLHDIHTSWITWIYCLIKIICLFGIDYSIWIDSNEYTEIEVTLYNLQLIVFILLLIIISFSDSKSLPDYLSLKLFRDLRNPQEIGKSKNPERSASFPNYITFWWFNKLALLGHRKALAIEDLWELRDDLKVSTLMQPFNFQYKRLSELTDKRSKSNLNGSSKNQSKRKVNIIRILVKNFGHSFLVGTTLKLVQDILQFISPQLLKLFINFIENQSEEQLWHGTLIACLLFVVTSSKTIFLNHYFYRMIIVGMQINSTLTAAIYRKSFNISDKAMKQITSGEIINLISVDCKRFLELMPYINLLWSAPFQILMTTFFLFLELGYSAFCGILVMIFLVPIDGVSIMLSRKLQVSVMDHRDERVKAIKEILNGIRIIKFYAWEKSFLRYITSLREKEEGQLRKLSYLEYISAFIWHCSPTIVSVTTFASYVLLQGGTLTAEKAFVSLSLFHIMKFPLSMIPELLSSLIMASVSTKRINKFLNLDELDAYVTRNSDELDVLKIENGSFRWSPRDERPEGNSRSCGFSNKKCFYTTNLLNDEVSKESDGLTLETKPSLRHINMKVKPGSFVAIVGSVGSGKSSLLSAILGEMEKISGRININGKYSIAYVAQQAWIQNTSLKNNILFGSPFDESKYNQVISACALEPDIAYLPGGDETEIGEKGINLSGGQKQRVSLARACYSDSNLFILDDPLSAVDAHVAQHIFKKVLSSKTGILKNKTRVLVTNKLDLLSKVDSIYVLTNGVITENGTYKQLMEAKGEFCDLVEQFTNRSIENDNEQHEELSVTESIEKKDIKSAEKTDDQKKKLIEAETLETGKVKWSIYWEYFGMVSFLWTTVIIVAHASIVIFSLISDLWLSEWSSEPVSKSNSLSTTKFRVMVYSILGLVVSITTSIGSFAIIAGTSKASIEFHEKLLYNVFRLPISFFDTNPLGRIVNRFYKDMDTIDTTLPEIIHHWIIFLFEVVITCVIISFNTPMFVLVLIPLICLYGYIQTIYIGSSRQLKRLEAVTRSPIYSHFRDSLCGVNSIRAFGVTQRFIEESANLIDINVNCFHQSVVANRWLSTRLEFCGNLVILATAIFAILARSSLGAGTAGLSLSYALTLINSLSWLVRMSSELETNIVAVERIMEYCKLKSEADWYEGKIMPPDDWPSKGSIKFDRYETRYREGTELILKGISGEIKGLEKIGIVGRTGAGKSTVTLSLFRLIEGSGGSISIDGLNISELPLHPLRSRLAIIPQDPVLFGGTLRFNLDPFDCYSDNDIWDALSHAHLKQFVNNTGQGLNYQIAEEGKNLSVGQRQLLCLARALLKKPKILFLDEATAAIDLETDSLIQKTIRTEFKDCTILTIAHRLNTILDSDRVMVLDQGQIAEFDEPKVLLENKQSTFYSLAKEANLVS